MTERMGKLDRLLQLVHLLADSSDGVTLDDMANEIGVNRRTVERMRDIVELHFDLENMPDEWPKRFRIPDTLRRVYTRPTAAEVAALKTEIDALVVAGHDARVAPLQMLFGKIRGALDRHEKRRMDTDFEDLSRLQRTAFQAGRRGLAKPGVMAVIQQAILDCRCVEFTYRRIPEDEPKWRRVVVHGLVHGAGAYLVGKVPGSEREPVYYLLDRMSDVRVSEVDGKPSNDWSLDAWLAENFAVWRDEEQYDIVLRIMPSGVARAREWQFHPHQSVVDEGEDLVIRFRAGGLRALAEHLFGWGDTVRIEHPPALRDGMREGLASAQRALSDADMAVAMGV